MSHKLVETVLLKKLSDDAMGSTGYKAQKDGSIIVQVNGRLKGTFPNKEAAKAVGYVCESLQSQDLAQVTDLYVMYPAQKGLPADKEVFAVEDLYLNDDGDLVVQGLDEEPIVYAKAHFDIDNMTVQDDGTAYLWQISDVEEGNNVGNSLPSKLDSFLQDVAQEFGTIDYGDIIKLKATPEIVQKLKALHKAFQAAAETDDDEGMEKVAADVASAVKQPKNESIQNTMQKPLSKLVTSVEDSLVAAAVTNPKIVYEAGPYLEAVLPDSFDMVFMLQAQESSQATDELAETLGEAVQDPDIAAVKVLPKDDGSYLLKVTPLAELEFYNDTIK